MSIRILAILIVLGVLVRTVAAQELVTPSATATLVESGDATDLDDQPAVTHVVPTVAAIRQLISFSAWSPSAAVPDHRHCLDVFRPPRGFAFN